MKQKKCRICKTPFDTAFSTRVVCSVACSLRLVERNKAKREKLEQANKRKRIREAKERIKTRRDWVKEAQQAFNQFIRERDYHLPCICCGQWGSDETWKTGGQFDAGHFLGVGSHPELRFNEDNCHKQLKSCNAGAGKYARKNHTVTMEYRERLIQKIGLSRVEALEGPHQMPRLTADDLKAIRDHYRAEARRLRKERESVGNVTGLGMAESRSTVSDRDMEAAERDTVLPADMASRRAC
jgi:hypothetical protein